MESKQNQLNFNKSEDKQFIQNQNISASGMQQQQQQQQQQRMNMQIVNGISSASMNNTNNNNNNNINDNDDDENIVEATDPTGRFERFKKCLGIGAYKKVYMGFDTDEGVEIAWNELRLDHLTKKDIDKVMGEVQILQNLSHESIINLNHSWTDGRQVYFITELMTSGTLKTFIKKTKSIKPKIIKNWCRQILKGLVYLHSREPPIIHRDLKCDNIFINGNNGLVKIGDLGLATVKEAKFVSSVLGTPEFMAPELYEEQYDEKVDIYSFGMCVLEMVSKDYPYSECTNQAQIYKKVVSGIKPATLNRIQDVDTRKFIELCIEHDPDKRPTAQQLLEHEFLQDIPKCNNADVHEIQLQSASRKTSNETQRSNDSGRKQPQNHLIGSIVAIEVLSVDLPVIQIKMVCIVPVPQKMPSSSTSSHHSSISRPSQIYQKQEVKFPFDITIDTCETVVSEMVKEGVLNSEDQVGAVLKMQRVIDQATKADMIELRQRSQSLGVIELPSSARLRQKIQLDPQENSQGKDFQRIRSRSSPANPDFLRQKSIFGRQTVRSPIKEETSPRQVFDTSISDSPDHRRHSILSLGPLRSNSTISQTPVSEYHKALELKTNEIIQGVYISKFRRGQSSQSPTMLTPQSSNDASKEFCSIPHLSQDSQQNTLMIQEAKKIRDDLATVVEQRNENDSPSNQLVSDSVSAPIPAYSPDSVQPLSTEETKQIISLAKSVSNLSLEAEQKIIALQQAALERFEQEKGNSSSKQSSSTSLIVENFNPDTQSLPDTSQPVLLQQSADATRSRTNSFGHSRNRSVAIGSTEQMLAQVTDQIQLDPKSNFNQQSQEQ